ncbi:SDR family oxidoreductase [Frankia sp. CNm7]|uniref:SDR family oxidoreductase n=1 Tax=Frankia nepalensis TaxID=1836974 RepID=A0A937RJL4_9ACTN|nr:SDR family NAD(P)-dependent oxidoreductase [Frankia nepalensis]MBL7500822.1 SDR family oxidoreductase [Frankia nepalensis]MBL7515378.1 SDR family oxidoreductase [Frankia nepalensis]MBL7518306.1 SDR family oxidoreductase [Frankia nepalensis]MBL7631452.1 SDR family oxidoreductase [Frankia nepalensis]
MGECTDKVVLVTGAGAGIGAACARRLGDAGARVVVADLDEASAKGTADELERAGVTALALGLDVTDPDAVSGAVAAAVRTFGRLDLAVNNAGISLPRQPVDKIPVDDWRRVVETNLNGVFYCLRAEIPAMLEAGGGSIVNMASVLGVVGFTEAAAYVAAKHGVIGLTKTAALEYATRGIRINAVAPSFVDTAMMGGGDGKRKMRGAALLAPMARFATVDEVAEIVLFLLSDRSSIVTGSVYLADAGYAAR